MAVELNHTIIPSRDKNASAEFLAATVRRYNGFPTTLDADLVVDASGRGSHTPRWLEEMGYPKPAEERVDVALAYTTRCFRRCGDDQAVRQPFRDGSGVPRRTVLHRPLALDPLENWRFLPALRVGQGLSFLG